MPTSGHIKNNNLSSGFRGRFLRLFIAVIFLGAMTACGTMKNQSGEETVRESNASQTGAATQERIKAKDPFEGFNRAVYKFNEKTDQYVLKPLAKGYRAVVPPPVSKSISNFFSNLYDPANMLYNFLQGKPKAGFSDLGRFVVNSTVGIAGLFDVASKMGLSKHNEDFGQTLAVWGVGDGPYLVLPFFGPSNIRDGASLPVDWYTYPPNHMEEHSTRDKMFVVEVVDKRAQLLDASDILEQAAGGDPYAFVREAYRQRRLSLIYDGNPPQPPPPPGLFEEDEPAPQKSSDPVPGARQSR
ncbi:MAG TPA: VacJ family lipoprotein [Sulfuricaulis sp.]|nr:VacJ family lipoprotein [Sulfuricaulis sp.]